MQAIRRSFAALAVRPSASVLAEVRTGAIVSAATQLLRFPVENRTFTSSAQQNTWLLPKSGDHGSTRKGRPRVPTGGSTRGTTVVWGDYGLRMCDHHRRVSALQLKNAEDTIRKKLRGMKYRLYTRVACNIPVYTKGNETRMGTGKGSMDYWACRLPTNRVIFELKGEIHEQIVRDAFRVAAGKLSGNYETIKRGDAPCIGATKLTPENIKKLLSRKGAPIDPLNRYLAANPAAREAAEAAK
ncbi:mitochondrial ribosomal protein L16 [Pyronema omphalodes]|nr:mitochondrial ribosomal protein L16 [Pyronema omphalodes]